MGPYEHPDSFLWWSIASWCLDRRGASNWSDFQAHLITEVVQFPELFGMFLQWWPFFQPSPHRGNTIVCGWWLQILWLFPRKFKLFDKHTAAYCSSIGVAKAYQLVLHVPYSMRGFIFVKSLKIPNWMQFSAEYVDESERRSVAKASAIQVSTNYHSSSCL